MHSGLKQLFFWSGIILAVLVTAVLYESANGYCWVTFVFGFGMVVFATRRKESKRTSSRAGASIGAFNLSLPVLAGGCIAMSLPGLLSRVNGWWPFFFPPWPAYLCYALVAISAVLARTVSEQRGVFVVALALAASSTWLCWDPAMLNWVFSFNDWYGLVLDYVVPLVATSLAVPCFGVLMSRRLLMRGRQVA